MAATLTPSMLTLVREAKGWSQRDLAEKTALSQAFISKAENGLVDVPAERLEHIASVLDCPIELLTRPEFHSSTAMSCLHHRRRSSKLTAAAMRRIEGLAYLTRATVENTLDGLNAGIDTTLTPATAQNPVDVAREVRKIWSLAGPIPDLIDELEKNGFLVVIRPLGSRSQDAVSSWPADEGHPPVIVVNTGLAPDRQRFTIAHELAHLLLHPMPVEGQEGEADAFAAELLVPADEIKPALKGLTTADYRLLLDLKSEWRVSVGMLVRRALDVGAISERQFREFRLRLTRLGWDVNEPGGLPSEEPRLLRRAFDLARDRGMTDDEIAALALMTPASFKRHYQPTERIRLTLNSQSKPLETNGANK